MKQKTIKKRRQKAKERLQDGKLSKYAEKQLIKTKKISKTIEVTIKKAATNFDKLGKAMNDLEL